MKIPKLFQKTKLHAATTSARRPTQEFVDEPNMKLSSAFVVVLVLHVVAVGGIYAFNSIKSHQPVLPDESVRPGPQVKSEGQSEEAKPVLSTTANATSSKIYHVKSGDTVAKIAAWNGVSMDDLEAANGLKNVAGLRVGQEIKIPAKQATKPISTEPRHIPEIKSGGTAPKDSGEIYTVTKGDNPVLIAKKLHVNYDELLKLNKIDDPKKLQIGQKLRVPAKHKNDVASAQ